jgi:phosphoesterase RecJ-like protein
METVKKIVDKIMESNSIVIFSHVSPDGDSIGTSIALYLSLKEMGKEVYNCVDDKIPNVYNFLYGSEDIVSHDSLNKNNYDCLIFLDCADEFRAGKNAYNLLLKTKDTINIDHHASNNFFASYNLVESKAAATGEIVYDLILKMNSDITSDIAAALYVALITDTGSFRFDNVTSHTMDLASKLINIGVDINKVRVNLWESKSSESVVFLGKVLSTLEVSLDGTISWIIAKNNLINSMDIDTSELDQIINYPKSIKGVEIALYFKELSNGSVKIGFRSKKFVDVSKLAAFFNGGGHPRAAGCIMKGKIDDVFDKVIKKTEEFYEASLNKKT